MKNLLAELALGISLRDVEILCIQLFAAVLCGLLFNYFWQRKKACSINSMEVFGVTCSVVTLVSLSKYILPLAVISAAVVAGYLILAAKRESDLHDWRSALLRLTVITISVIAGSGYVLILFLFTLFALLPLLLVRTK